MRLGPLRLDRRGFLGKRKAGGRGEGWTEACAEVTPRTDGVPRQATFGDRGARPSKAVRKGVLEDPQLLPGSASKGRS